MGSDRKAGYTIFLFLLFFLKKENTISVHLCIKTLDLASRYQPTSDSELGYMPQRTNARTTWVSKGYCPFLYKLFRKPIKIQFLRASAFLTEFPNGKSIPYYLMAFRAVRKEPNWNSSGIRESTFFFFSFIILLLSDQQSFF